MKTGLTTLFTIAIVLLLFLLVRSVMRPIRFNQIREAREKAIIERLKDIRTAQEAYRAAKGTYTGSFDTLINFLKTDSLPVVFRSGSLTDEMIAAGITTEKEAARRGMIRRDTSYIPVRDSIFFSGYTADSLRYVPGMGNLEFRMLAGRVMTASRIEVNVFEASVLNDLFLADLNRQQLSGYNDQRARRTGFPGLKVGNILVPNNNAGNWEE